MQHRFVGSTELQVLPSPIARLSMEVPPSLVIPGRRSARGQLRVESTVRATAHSTGAPCSRQLTWAEKDGRSPSNAFGRSRVRLFIRSEADGPAVSPAPTAGRVIRSLSIPRTT
jgi:hypothetical protein